jgi:hypothetical protein
MAGTPNQSIKSNKNKKRSKNSYRSYATEYAGSTHNYNQMAGIPNQPIKSNPTQIIKIFQSITFYAWFRKYILGTLFFSF